MKESRKKRCQFLDEDGNRCYRSPCRTTIVFPDAAFHNAVWVAVDLCSIHYEKVQANLHRRVLEVREEKIQ